MGTVTVEQETTAPETDGGPPLRVVIGEDSVLLLAGLVKLLDSAGFQVVATAGDGTALVDAVEREQPDLVIADVRMPPTHTDEGIRAALAIRGRWPDIAILVLSQYVEERYAADLLSANTSSVGYLLKDRVADVTQFLEALRRVAAGGTALDPEVVAQLLLRRGADPMEALTQRERDVLALMAEGRSNAEIGAALVITDSAVSKHINSIFAKLGLHPERLRPPPRPRRPALPGRRLMRDGKAGSDAASDPYHLERFVSRAGLGRDLPAGAGRAARGPEDQPLDVVHLPSGSRARVERDGAAVRDLRRRRGPRLPRPSGARTPPARVRRGRSPPSTTAPPTGSSGRSTR